MQSVLITGAGFLARGLVKELLERDCRRICIYSRNEFNQYQMRQEFDNDSRLRFFIGCVRDKERLIRACHGIDVIIAAAALKRIEVGVYCPDELVKTNVIGTMNTIDAAYEVGAKSMVLVSTDKAAEPVSAYGQSKALAESLTLSANNVHGAGGPRFSVCRFGNVFRSTGSVVPAWEALIAANRNDAPTTRVPVTDPECTRFFMWRHEAAKLVVETAMEAPAGTLAIPDLPAYRLGDLAEAMGVIMDIRGLPKFEKPHEMMAHGNTSDKARRMSVQELREALKSV